MCILYTIGQSIIGLASYKCRNTLLHVNGSALKIIIIQKYLHQNIQKVLKVKVLVMQNDLNSSYIFYIYWIVIIDAFMRTAL